MTLKIGNSRKQGTKRNKINRRIFLLTLIFITLILLTNLISKIDISEREPKPARVRPQRYRPNQESIVVIEVNNLSHREQINYFIHSFEILPRLVRFSDMRDFIDVQLPVNRATVDLTYANFELTKFLNSLNWQQISGVESASREMQTLRFVTPCELVTYRFRIFYDRTGAYPQPKPKMAIIIKGFGELSLTDLERWLTLDSEICFSILPINRNSRMNINQITARGFEALLELPLEDPGHPLVFTEHYSIFGHFTDRQVITRLDEYFRLLPGASGVITHRGGLITTDRRIMPLILRYIRDKEMYFIDDRAIETSIAYILAQQMMLTSFERSITLNPRNYINDVNNSRLLADLRDTGRDPMIVTLQRPDIITFEFVQNLIQVVRANGWEIVRVSGL